MILTAVSRSIGEISEDDEQDELLSTKPLLDFLCIAAQSNTISNVLSSHTTLVPKLSGWACGFERGPMPVEHYRSAVVLLFGMLTHPMSKKKAPSYDAEAVHDIVLDRGPSHILGAGSYARYSMKLVERKAVTQLMRLETWDYFVDALHLSPDDPEVFTYRDLMEVSFSLYCAALNAALQALDPGSLQFVLASERTVSLANRLKGISEAEVEDEGLSSLNKTAANFLLGKIKAALSGSSIDAPFPIKFRLMYAEFKGSMHVITVPRREDQ